VRIWAGGVEQKAEEYLGERGGTSSPFNVSVQVREGATSTGFSITIVLRSPLGVGSVPKQPRPTSDASAAAGDVEISICREVVDGKPVGAGTDLDAVSKVVGFYAYREQPAGEIECIWYRDGQELVRSTQQLKPGTGSTWFTMSIRDGQPLPAARYQAVFKMDGRTQGLGVYVCVNHRGAHVRVPQQFLHLANVQPIVKRPGIERQFAE
jgi:hypothetical protein